MKEKSFIGNTLYNILYKVCSLLFPFIISVYSSRVLLAEGVGKVAFANNIVSYFTLLAAMGIPNYGIREVARARNDKKELNKVFSELFIVNTISTTICLVAYYLIINSNSFFSKEITLYNIVGISIFLNYFNVDWLYSGIEEFKFIAVRSIIVKILLLFAVVVFVKDKNDYVVYAFISCLAIAGNYIWNILLLNSKGITFAFKQIHIVRHIKPIVILLCTTLSIELYTLLDTTMLGVWGNDKVVGYYSNASRLVKVFITLIVSVSGALLPRLSLYYKEKKYNKCSELINKVFSYLFLFAVPVGVGIFMLAPEMVDFMYGETFDAAINTVRILSLLTFVLSFSNLFGTQILLTVKCEKKLLFATMIGAFTNIILNSLLIPSFYQDGAAIASVISETIVTCLTFGFARQYFYIKTNKRTVVSVSLASLIMMGVMVYIKRMSFSNIEILICSFVIGVIVYFSTLLVLKNREAMEMVKIVKSWNQKK